MSEPKLVTEEQLQYFGESIVNKILIPLKKLLANIPKAIYDFFQGIAGDMVKIAKLVVSEAGQLKDALEAITLARSHLQLTASADSVDMARSDFIKTVQLINNAAEEANRLAEAHKMNLPPIPPLDRVEQLVHALGFFLDKAIDKLPAGHLQFATSLHNDLHVMANAAEDNDPIWIGSTGTTVSLVILKFWRLSINYMKEWCPNDLSVTASVAGEGGGTELCGHPSKQFVGGIVLVIDYIILVLETAEKLSKDT